MGKVNVLSQAEKVDVVIRKLRGEVAREISDDLRIPMGTVTGWWQQRWFTELRDVSVDLLAAIAEGDSVKIFEAALEVAEAYRGSDSE